MARIGGVDRSFNPVIQLSYWYSRHSFGEVGEPLTIMAHQPGLLAGYGAFETALSRSNSIDPQLKQLAEIKAATIVGCELCIDIGSMLGRELGITDDQLRDLSVYEESDVFSPLETLVLHYTVAMTETPQKVPEDLFESLCEHFDEAQLVELTAAIALENFRARFNNAFGMTPHGFSEGEYCPMPETPSSTHSQQPQ